MGAGLIVSTLRASDPWEQFPLSGFLSQKAAVALHYRTSYGNRNKSCWKCQLYNIP